jgi:diguanylate cyclase (GGDEF)-like protein/PAS domain S-box-containing protein
VAHRCSIALACALLAVTALAAEPRTPLPRHPLETRALVAPDEVIDQLPAAIEGAQASGDHRTVALLQLAHANACRVIADWSCQLEASVKADEAAARAGDDILRTRAKIAEGRARIALQDHTRGEHVLGEVELLLQKTPSPELSADLYLAYSSLSHNLGKHTLAVQYAERGLDALSGVDEPTIKARLLRNSARARAQLGDLDAARRTLADALAQAAKLDDPKLAAELHLEAARVARSAGDVAEQRRNGDRILELAQEVRNSQLDGIGREVLGLADLDSGDLASAERRLEAALASFRELAMPRDELRVARELLAVKLGLGEGVTGLTPLIRRFVAINDSVTRSDRAQAADDFDARLKYAQQDTDVRRLEAEAGLAREREKRLADTNRLTRWLNLLAAAVATALAGIFVLQRRANSRLRGALTALRQSELRATELLRTSKGFVFLHDAGGELLMANPATAQALGLSADALVGRRLAEFVPDPGRAALAIYLERVQVDGQHDGVLVLRQRDDTLRHWRYSSRLTRPEGARPYVIGQAVDVTDQVRQTETLRSQSRHDALTGAFNRRYLEDFEPREAEHGPWGAIVIDLDHFKHVNDTQGHERGDQVLVQFAQFLAHTARESDAVVRSGGDEFLVLLANTSESAVAALAARIIADAQAAPAAFSIGHAVREGTEALAATIARADAAMYSARSVARANAPPDVARR